jgi:hypothetical protein
MQGRSVARAAHSRYCAALEQQRDEGGIAVTGGPVDRRDAGAIDAVDVGPTIREEHDELRMPELETAVDDARTVTVARADRRTAIQ